MKMFRVRLFLSESRWNDIELPGYTCWDAENLGRGMSPTEQYQYIFKLSLNFKGNSNG